MLNFTAGASGLISACQTAEIKTVITARKFVRTAELDDVVGELSRKVEVLYLEDIAERIPLLTKLRGFVIARFDFGLKQRHRQRNPVAVGYRPRPTPKFAGEHEPDCIARRF